MSDLVADSCAVIKWLVDEPGTPEALRLLNDNASGELQLFAPDLIHAEITNVLWKKVHRRLLAEEAARRAFSKFQRIPFQITASAELLEEMMQIALSFDQSSYDCYYVASSNRIGCPLVTSDAKLVRKVSRAYPQVSLLAGL